MIEVIRKVVESDRPTEYCGYVKLGYTRMYDADESNTTSYLG